MVESGCHVVFVLFPGVKEFIDQRYTSNQSFFMIKRAIKVVFVVKLVVFERRKNFLYHCRSVDLLSGVRTLNCLR